MCKDFQHENGLQNSVDMLMFTKGFMMLSWEESGTCTSAYGKPGGFMTFL